MGNTIRVYVKAELEYPMDVQNGPPHARPVAINRLCTTVASEVVKNNKSIVDH